MAECSYAAQSCDPFDEAGIRLCKTSPKFLESNATSHTWAFSAIAELIDNAYDPDVRATEIRIDHTILNGNVCMTFIDDGNGLSEDQLYRMLSFGYSDKPDAHGYKAIGRYGNGFKSGSMRLGKDALVLTKQMGTMSVGLLSQTFHERINADTVRIPIVTFDRSTLKLADPVDQNKKNLDAILAHSIFSSADELIDQLTMVPDFKPDASCGTKIIIWNLRKFGTRLELQCRSDIKDIVWDDAAYYSDTSAIECPPDLLDFRHSLRKYCSILYLRPRMKIFIMGEKVRSRLIAKDLCKTAVDTYKMKGETTLSITFGFNPSRGGEDKGIDYGVILYHKNRLIKAYEKVGCQKLAVPQALGVVGVAEADILTPNHNKQDFNVDEKYHRVMNALTRKLNEYWEAKTASSSNQVIPKQELLEPDCNWVQCDECLKWRRLPEGAVVDAKDTWFCSMHPTEYISNMACRAPEDRLDVGEVDLDVPSTYRKEKQIVARKRKSSAVRRRTESPVEDRNIDAARTKRQRVENDDRTGLVSDVRRKIDELNRRTQLMLAEPAIAVGDVADAIHMDREQDRDDDEARTVFCMRCHSWKKLPTGCRVADRTTWVCSQHPDETQRCCDLLPLDDDDDRPPVVTENASNRSSPTHDQSLSGGIRFSSTPSIPSDERLHSITADHVGHRNEDVNGENADVRAIQASLAQLESQITNVVNSRRIKPERSAVGCQTDHPVGTSADNAEAHASACPNCAEGIKLREAQEQIAQFLNILFREENLHVRPENALEQVTVLLKNHNNP